MQMRCSYRVSGRPAGGPREGCTAPRCSLPESRGVCRAGGAAHAGPLTAVKLHLCVGAARDSAGRASEHWNQDAEVCSVAQMWRCARDLWHHSR
ncbi:hypothetical protein NDU88_003554 [Pleurodeles waltl]|uniref:Uncharacterized protein n=1 Tax=Pleurodeles waltl TaxID=8319 RepID=A0AAV7VGY6_PLEWA|nr:hypothetical protein NDU88_003554 [Pleurodeles waltl]